MIKTTFSKRLMSIFLCVALMLTYVPITASAAAVNPSTVVDTIADPGTAANWETMMGTSIDGNRYAGRVWVDKSVYTDGQNALLNSRNEAGSSFAVSLEDDEAFQVIFSALGSSMTTTESFTSSGPMDIVLVIDNSRSMTATSGGTTRYQKVVTAANTLIGDLTKNGSNRIGIVTYNRTSETVLELNNYKNGVNLTVNNYSWREGNGVLSAVDNSGNVLGKDSGYQSNTNLQSGIDRGMNMLATATNVAGRKPVVIVLTDGAANHAVRNNWYNVSAGTVTSGGDASAPVALSTILNAAYNKARIQKNYAHTTPVVYSISVDLSEGDAAHAIMDPANAENGFNSNNRNDSIDDAYTAYLDWADGESVTLREGWTEWVFDQLPANNAVKRADVINHINYVDTAYDVTSAELGDTFDQISAELTSAAFNPISSTTTTDGATGVDNTPLIYVDFIGQYMEIKEIEAVTLFGSSYGVINNGDGTYTVASATGVNPTTDETWKTDEDIQISVTEQADGTQKLEIRINQEILPIIMEQVVSKTVGKETTSTITEFVYDPLRVYYTVGVASDILLPNGDVDVSKIQGYEYIDNANGTVSFYSNRFGVMNPAVNGAVSMGDAHVGFRPSAQNRYYYYQSNQGVFSAIHKKSDGSAVSIPPNEEYGMVWDDGAYELTWMSYDEYLTKATTDKVYTYVTYYHPTPSATDAANAAEKVTYLVYADWSYLKESVGFYDAVSKKYVNYNNGTYSLDEVGKAMTAEQIATYAQNNPSSQLYAVLGVGAMRTSRLHNMETYKTANNTGTAEHDYDPVFLHTKTEHEDHNDNDVVVWLGNNGKLTVAIDTGIALTKSVTEAIGNLNDTYALTVTVPSGVVANPVVTDAHGTDVTASISNYRNNVLTVNVKAGETVYVSGIPGGTVCTVGEIIPQNAGYYISQKTDTVTVPTLAQVLNGAAQFVSATVTNAPKKYGNLTIVKDVLHHLEQTPETMSNKAFTFKVQLPATLAGEYAVDKTNASLFTADKAVVGADGSFTVTLKDNESITVKGLPEGTTYTVTEEGSVSGYTNTTGAVTGTIVADADATAHFVNTYTTTPIKPSVTVNGTKTVKDEQATYTQNEEFVFVLSQYVGISNEHPTGYVELGTDTAKDGKNYSFDLAALLTTELDLGEHYFRVTERTGSTAGMIYDASRGLFSVVVTDENADGVLEYKLKNYANTQINGNTVTKDFTNTYDVDLTYVDINITKSLTNDTGVDMPMDIFHFELVNTADANDKYVATTDASGEATIRISDLNVGTHQYQYKLTEVDGGIDGMDYDDAEYVVNITVKNNAGTLVAVAEVVGATQTNGDNTIEVTFDNTYTLTPVKNSISGTKVLQGRNPQDKEFAFALYETDSSFVISDDPIDVTENIGSAFSFDEITYSKVGTYYYSVKEIRGSKAGVTYDTTHYHVTLTVGIDSTDATKLAVTDVSINKIGSNSHTSGEIVFVNQYKTAPTSYQFGGHKLLDGRAMQAGEFTFALYEGDVELRTATNKADGGFVFDAIDYDKAGVYTYTVKELEPTAKAPGVTYSGVNSPVTVTVTVEDKNAQLVVDKVVFHDKNGAELPDGITFENTYAAKPAQVTFNGEKIFDGGELTEGLFAFNLYQTDHTFGIAREIPLDSEENDNEGKFSFTQEFSETGMYFFVITEDIADPIEGVVYDTSKHTFAVRVSDSGDGQLKAAVMNVDNGTVSALDASVSVDVNFTNATFDEAVEKEVYLTGNTTHIDGQKVEQGTILTYFITYKNYTGDDVEVDILDTIPKHTTYVDGSASHDGTYAADHINWILSVARGESVTVSFDVKVTDTEAIVANTAVVRDGVNTYTTNEVVNHTVDEPLKKDVFYPADIHVSIDGAKVYAGDELIYKISFTNASAKTTDVTITDTIPSGTTYVDGSADNGGVYKDGTIVWNIEDVPAWTTVTVAFKVTVNADADAVTIKNTATATDGKNNYTTNAVSNPVSKKTEETTTPDDPQANTPDPSVPGSPLTGDTANIHLWFALLFVSGGGIVVTSIFGKRKKASEKA